MKEVKKVEESVKLVIKQQKGINERLPFSLSEYAGVVLDRFIIAMLKKTLRESVRV